MSEEEADAVEEEEEVASGEDGLDSESLAEVATQFSEAFSKDLSALLGPAAAVEVKGTRSVSAADLECLDVVVDQQTRSEGDQPRDVHLLCPTPDAIGLAALQAGLEGDAVGEAREGGDFAAHSEGFGEVMKLAAAVLTRLLEPHEFGDLQLRDARPLEDASSNTAWLGDGTQWCIDLELGVEGFDPAPLLILIGQGDGKAAGDSLAEEASVIIIDSDGEERDRIEEASEEQEKELAAIDPADFGDDSRESIQEADAVIVAWELGGRSGLEFVEHLVRNEQTSGTIALLAHERATRGMVECALRAGARGFVLRPYDLVEIQRAVAAARRS
ncbi:MAG: response regulator [bacterium]|nr:response regulator [bacterium]